MPALIPAEPTLRGCLLVDAFRLDATGDEWTRWTSVQSCSDLQAHCPTHRSASRHPQPPLIDEARLDEERRAGGRAG